MKVGRILLVLPGLAALAYGIVLFLDYAVPAWPDSFTTVLWIGGGPIVNDAVFAPVAAVVGLLLARILPKPWRTPVQVGAMLTAVLVFVAFPLLWRTYGVPSKPGLHDGNAWLGLTWTLVVVWTAVAGAVIVRVVRVRWRARRKVRPDAGR